MTLTNKLVLIFQLCNLIVIGTMFLRNLWFIRAAQRLNDEEYLRLPTFHKIWWRLWCWDLRKQLREGHHG